MSDFFLKQILDSENDRGAIDTILGNLFRKQIIYF
jgi:hypothetical protein